MNEIDKLRKDCRAAYLAWSEIRDEAERKRVAWTEAKGREARADDELGTLRTALFYALEQEYRGDPTR